MIIDYYQGWLFKYNKLDNFKFNNFLIEIIFATLKIGIKLIQEPWLSFKQ